MNSNSEKKLGGAKRQTILLVDDDPSVREVLGRVLAAEGYVVLAAANGEEALEVAVSNKIHLVLLDLNMPGQGGWETCVKLTAHDPLRPVIIVTAQPNQLFMSAGAGASALLEKPFDYLQMLRIVRTVLSESPQTRWARGSGQHADFHYLASGGEALA